MRTALLLVFLVILTACSSSKVVTDYDLKTDFSKYTSFQFYEDVGKGLNDLDVKRFEKTIQAQLDSLKIIQSKTPNFYINFYSEKRESNRKAIGVGVGGPYNGGVTISTDVLFGISKVEELITLEFVDSTSNQLIWQGKLMDQVKEKITPKEREIWVAQVVKKLLLKFPK